MLLRCNKVPYINERYIAWQHGIDSFRRCYRQILDFLRSDENKSKKYREIKRYLWTLFIKESEYTPVDYKQNTIASIPDCL